jgi:hypothetical protein
MMEYLLNNELEITWKAAVMAQFETDFATAAFCRKEGVKLRRALWLGFGSDISGTETRAFSTSMFGLNLAIHLR